MTGLARVSQFAMLIGVFVAVTGIRLDNWVIAAVGGVILFAAAYVMVFAKFKSF